MTKLLLALLLGSATVAPAARFPLVYMAESGEEKHVVLWTGGTEAPRQLTSGSDWHLYPDISADGRQVAFIEGKDQNHLGLKLLTLSSGQQRWLIPPEGQCLHPRFSGDSRLLAFSAAKKPGGTRQIGWLDPTETQPTVHWLQTAYPAFFPSPASDGHFLVFQGDLADGSKVIMRRNRDEPGEPQALTDPKGVCMAPSLSADDRWVAFTSKVDGNWDVYALDLQTGTKRRLTADPARDFAPEFRPDGSLVFASDRSGQFQLYQVPVSALNQPEPAAALLLSGPGALYAPRSAGDPTLTQDEAPPIPPPARSSFGAGQLGGDLYVVGGHQGHEHTYPPESFLDQVARFEAASSRWRSVAPRPAKAHGLQVVAHGQYLYAFGGFAYAEGNTPHWTSLDRVDRYDPAHDRWEQVATLPRKRSSHVAVKVGTQVYLIGGWDSTPKAKNDTGGRFHPEIDVFDLTTGTCSVALARLPDPLRRAFSACRVGDQIVMAGGIGVGSHVNLIDTVTAFDPAKGTFTALPALPFPTFAPALGEQHGSLYLFGGMFGDATGDYRYVNHVFTMNPRDGRGWTHTGRYLREAKGFAQVVGHDDDGLSVLGGHAYLPDGTDTPVATVERFRLVTP